DKGDLLLDQALSVVGGHDVRGENSLWMAFLLQPLHVLSNGRGCQIVAPRSMQKQKFRTQDSNSRDVIRVSQREWQPVRFRPQLSLHLDSEHLVNVAAYPIFSFGCHLE